MAQRIKQCIRAEDMAARMGGDEFVILLNYDMPVNLNILCQRLIREITEPYEFENNSLLVGASIGNVQLADSAIINEPESSSALQIKPCIK